MRGPAVRGCGHDIRTEGTKNGAFLTGLTGLTGFWGGKGGIATGEGTGSESRYLVRHNCQRVGGDRGRVRCRAAVSFGAPQNAGGVAEAVAGRTRGNRGGWKGRHNPLWGYGHRGRGPKVAPKAAQPLGYGHNPFGIGGGRRRSISGFHQGSSRVQIAPRVQNDISKPLLVFGGMQGEICLTGFAGIIMNSGLEKAFPHPNSTETRALQPLTI